MVRSAATDTCGFDAGIEQDYGGVEMVERRPQLFAP
jgi:hypothetical protein